MSCTSRQGALLRNSKCFALHRLQLCCKARCRSGEPAQCFGMHQRRAMRGCGRAAADGCVPGLCVLAQFAHEAPHRHVVATAREDVAPRGTGDTTAWAARRSAAETRAGTGARTQSPFRRATRSGCTPGRPAGSGALCLAAVRGYSWPRPRATETSDTAMHAITRTLAATTLCPTPPRRYAARYRPAGRSSAARVPCRPTIRAERWRRSNCCCSCGFCLRPTPRGLSPGQPRKAAPTHHASFKESALDHASVPVCARSRQLRRFVG